jgi:predicted 2-oxoglutarate/Fe(II)-dependent dioxygenase YbiX
MPGADFFVPLGLFVRKAFLPAGECTRICAEARACESAPAAVHRRGGDGLAEEYRKTRVVRVSPGLTEAVDSRLRPLKAELEAHFGTPLRSYEELQFLAYRPGDYFHPHRDSSADDAAATHIRERLISVVLFLNGASENPADGAFSGGALTFYGLVADPAWEKYGFPLIPEAGLLVAFRSDVRHAVEPVSHGERYTVVTWLY